MARVEAMDAVITMKYLLCFLSSLDCVGHASMTMYRTYSAVSHCCRLKLSLTGALVSHLGMAKVKMSKEESGSQDFVEKRRAALERSEVLLNAIYILCRS